MTTINERALAINEKTYGSEHRNAAIYLNNLGRAWQALGKAKKAIQYLEKAVVIDEKTYGNEHLNVAIGLGNLGKAWQVFGEANKAVPYYERALAIFEKVYGKEHPNVAVVREYLAAAKKASNLASKNQGDVSSPPNFPLNHKGAKTERLLNELKVKYNNELLHPDYFEPLHVLGQLWKEESNHNNAFYYLVKATQMYEQFPNQIDPLKVGQLFNILGNVCRSLKRYNEAGRYLLKSLEIKQEFYKKPHAEIAKTLNNLGTLYFEKREFDTAYKYFLDKNHFKRDFFLLKQNPH